MDADKVQDNDKELDHIEKSFQRIQRRLIMNDHEHVLDFDDDDESMLRSTNKSGFKSIALDMARASQISKKSAATIDDIGESKFKCTLILNTFIIIMILNIISLTVARVAMKDDWFKSMIAGSMKYLVMLELEPHDMHDAPCNNFQQPKNNI